jgi:hypothetical protein
MSRTCLRDVGVGEKWHVTLWTGLIWLRTRTGWLYFVFTMNELPVAYKLELFTCSSAFSSSSSIPHSLLLLLFFILSSSYSSYFSSSSFSSFFT